VTTNDRLPSAHQPGDRIFYGWIIVVAAVFIACTLLGIRFSFGVFFKSLEVEFDLTRVATSSVFSIYMIIFAIFALVSGWALDKYGPRLVVALMGLFTGLSLVTTSLSSSLWQLYLSYSLLLAIGTGGTIPVLMAVVSRWFERKRGFALGIATSGAGLGTLFLAPLAAYLISIFGWRMSYVILGVIAWLVVISLAMLLRREPSEIGALPYGVKLKVSTVAPTSTEASSQAGVLSLSQAIKTRSFWLMLSVWFLFAVCINLVITHIVAHATDIGISTIEASTLLSMVGGLNILARLSMGPVSDITGRKIPGIFCALLGAAAFIWLIYSHSLWMFYLFAIVFGFSWGGFGVIIITLVSDVFGRDRLGTIMGVLEFGFSIGSAAGPAFGG